jgi:tetratricopeptide (TPR) repeat protein
MSTARCFAVMALASLAAAMPLVFDRSLAQAADVKDIAPHDRSLIVPAASKAGSPSGSQVDGLIAQGRDALKRGDFDAATIALDTAIALDPANALALHSRGVVRMLKRDYDGAIADLDKALSIDANDFEGYRVRGNVWFLKRDRERAISDYNRAIDLNPHDSVAYLLRSIYWIAQNNRAKAILDLDRAIAEDPRSVEAYLQRGLLYEYEKKFDLAFADYDAVIGISPYNVRAYTRRAGIWLQRGPSEENLNRAIADLQQAVRVNSGDQLAKGQLQQMIAMKELLQKAKSESRAETKAANRIGSKADAE